MENNFDIAIIGMACRFPGADDLDAFWNNLANGVESIRHFTDEELKQSGIPDSLINNPNYVKASPTINDPGMFDASFFGYTPMEAKMMDPQHRILLECAYQALEHSGYDAEKYKGRIGVFTGSAMNTYFMNNILRSKFVDEYIPTLIGNDKDFLSTRISYKLNLKGPSINVQTACSTSLVAVHLACQSLNSEESDIVLAGAVSVKAPHKAGYVCDGGGIVSPDAHVRAFDSKANGTVFGSGCGVVVLKRLSDAIKDGDTIHAVIKGSALNNDGSEKAGYTAPSVNSQANAVIEALSLADVDAETITYVEAHGSGTPLGDPIELAALTKAFQNFTDNKKFCAIGSVKTNVGHLDAAAGIAGLIKTVLALKNNKIPPSINYSEPNPEIDFQNSPFSVSTQLKDWKSSGLRRAGIMSTGMGGTNAFVILEEAPATKNIDQSKLPNLLVLSAKNEEALDNSTKNLSDFLKQDDKVNLEDVSYTLQQGRRSFKNRRFIVCKDKKDAIEILENEKSKLIFTSELKSTSKRPIVFLLPGIGDHYVGMGYDLYQNVKAFKEEVDKCAEILNKYLDVDIREILYPKDYNTSKPENGTGIDLKKMLAGRVNKSADANTQKLNQTIYAQPALFTIEYALANLWIHLGIVPDAIVGHSMGEYVAACLAGVFTLEEALKLIAVRAELVNSLSKGRMLAVTLSEKELLPLLTDGLSISLINSPNLCVVAGPEEDVDKFEKVLKDKKILYRHVQNVHAFHSEMMKPIHDEFIEEVRKVNLKSPQISYTSNLTGNWIAANEAADPVYWAKHTTNTARFSDALEKVWQIDNCVLLEVGPGNTLSVLAMQHPGSKKNDNPITISSLRPEYDNQSDLNFLLTGIGKLWLNGIEVDWDKLYENNRPKRIPLPTYPFQKKKYWIGNKQTEAVGGNNHKPVEKSERKEFNDWFYVPGWKRSELIWNNENLPQFEKDTTWLVFLDDLGIGSQIKNFLEELNETVVAVQFGNSFSKGNDNQFTINPNNSEDYISLFQELNLENANALNIIHLGSFSDYDDSFLDYQDENIQHVGFYSLLFIAQAVSKLNISKQVNIEVVSNHVHQVNGDEILSPKKSLILGACGAIPKEIPNVKCFNVDLLSGNLDKPIENKLITNLIGEFDKSNIDRFIAYRGNFRWIKKYDRIDIGKVVKGNTSAHLMKKNRVRQRGVYLITGGTGGIGLTIAKYLAEEFQARIVLTQKSEIPEKSKWKKILVEDRDDDVLNEKLERLIELEELGGEVIVFKADASNPKEMKNVIAKTKNIFGEINGIIHSAGIVNAGIIQAKEKKSIQNVFAPKVEGTLILHDLVKDMDLDFFALCSSVTSIITPYAEVDYSAANAFLDSFSQYSNSQNKLFTVSINWSGWSQVGQLVKLKTLKGTEKWKEEALRNAISPEQGLEAFKLIMNTNFSQVAVSPESLENPAKEVDPQKLFNITEHSFRERVEEKDAHIKETANDKNKFNSTEDELSLIWKDLLGVDGITKTDNFFELGGHSLLAIQLISALRDTFHIDLGLEEIFNTSNLSEMADKINELTSIKVA